MLPRLHITIERWKWNEHFQVWVSNLGNLKDREKRPIKPLISSKGYMLMATPITSLGNWPVHRLVMETWRPLKGMEDMTVDHINHNKRDNTLQNLEWVTFQENQRRATSELYTGATYNLPTASSWEPVSEETKAPAPLDPMVMQTTISLWQGNHQKFVGSVMDGAKWIIENVGSQKATSAYDMANGLIKTLNRPSKKTYCGLIVEKEA